MTAKLQIAVVKAFLLTLADGTVKKFEEGLHEVEESIASHWYVKAHSNVVEPAADLATDTPPPPSDAPTPPPPNNAEQEPLKPEPAQPDEAPADAEAPPKKKK